MLRKIVKRTGTTKDVVRVTDIMVVERTVTEVVVVGGIVTEVLVIGGADVDVNNAGVVMVTGITVARGTPSNGAVTTVSVARMSVAIKSVTVGLLIKRGVAGWPVAWVDPPWLQALERISRKEK